MTQNSEILIIGAGWRVRNFILPALQILQIPDESISILRKSRERFSGAPKIKVFDDISKLSDDYAMIINCASADVMLGLQRQCLRRFPKAIHFIDTPIIPGVSALPKTWPLLLAKNLFSLEDWPLLPNILMLRKVLKSNGQIHFKHFGIPNHFLSAARVINKSNWVRYQKTDRILSAGQCHYFGPKNYDAACIEIISVEKHIEDRFEVNPITSPENQLYRRYADGNLQYCLNDLEPLSVHVPQALIEKFISEPHAKAVHEFDKIIALTRILQAGMDRRYNDLYPVQDALKDVVIDVFVKKARKFPFL